MSEPPVAGFPTTAPQLRGRAIMDQYWSDLTFLHWPVRPADVARFFPPGTRPDVFDGLSYVGLVPFRMRRAGFGRGRPVPWFGSFGEVNVRLYSRDDAGRHGVVFRTLDADRAAVVLGARLGLGLPYTWARITTESDGAERRYTVRRRWPRPAVHTDIRVRVGDRVEPEPVEVFLTARWGLHTGFGHGTMWIPNEHRPWPLHRAQVVGLDDGLVAAAGVTRAGPMLRPLWSPGVRTAFGRPVLLERH